MSNIGTYFEIPVTDMDRAIDFYSYVFDCEFSKNTLHGCEMAYFPLYLSTADVDGVLTRVIEKGGIELFPKTEVPDYGFSAEFKDCEGNRIGLFQSN